MILFVDYNDVYRAPLAAVFYTQTHGVPADSAGVYADEGAALPEAACPPELKSHRARQLSAAMLQTADAVFCMTAAIAQHLRESCPQRAEIIQALDVPDPFGMGPDGYQACRAQLARVTEALP